MPNRQRPAHARTKGRRLLAFLGGTVALAIAVTVVLLVSYATVNLEDLKSRVPRLDGTRPEQPIDRAADSAMGFAEEMAEPAPTAPGSATYVLRAEPPPGVDAAPGHWCAPVIGYRVDPTAVLAAGSTLAIERERWRAAAATWTRASGGRYRFQYRGTADYPVLTGRGDYPIDPREVPAGEIALTYASSQQAEEQVPGYVHAKLRDTLGFAGPGPISWSTGSDQGEITSGMVVLDAQDAVADPHAVPTAYVHELGHALGLGHVTDGRQVMDADSSATTLGNGDRTGIRRLAALRCS